MEKKRNTHILQRLLRYSLAVRSGKISEEKFFERFCEVLMELGGVYTKFLQGVLLSRTLKHSKNEVLNIFERNKFPDINIEDLLENYLGEKAKNLQQLSAKPIAVGSYSAVYQARLNNQLVAVKVLRPNIEKELRHDLRFLGVIAHLYKIANIKMVPLDLPALYKPFRRSCLLEIDFKREVVAMNYVRQYFANEPRIVVPEVYEDYSNSQIIVQEWIEGLSLTDVLEAKLDGYNCVRYVHEVCGSDLREVLTLLGGELCLSSLLAEYTHGDPHPGNIRILPHNSIALIDFGLSAGPYPRDVAPYVVGLWRTYIKLIKGELDGGSLLADFMGLYQKSLYQAILSLCVYTKHDPQYIFSRVAEILNLNEAVARRKDSIDDNDSILSLFKDAVGNVANLGFKLQIGHLEVQRSLHTFVQLLDSLGLKRELWPVILSQAVERIERDHADLVHSHKIMLLDEAVEYLYAWSERLSPLNSEVARQLQNLFIAPKSDNL